MFVDRVVELAQATASLDQPRAGHEAGAVVLNCSGMPGAGKSVFGLRLAHEHAARFPGGVLYANFRHVDGSFRSASDVATQLLRDLGVAPDAVSGDEDQQFALLRSLLVETPVLLLLDNVRSEADVRHLVPANRESLVVITSTAPLGGLGAAHLLALEPFEEADALLLLRTLVGERVDREPDAARAIAAACHGLPMAVAIAGAKLRRRPKLTLAAYVTAVEGAYGSLSHLTDRERDLRATFAASIVSLPPRAKNLLLLLAVLDVSDIEPSLCAALLGASHAEAAAAIAELEVEQLLVVAPNGLHQMHGLLRVYCRAQANEHLDEALIASAQERRVQWLTEEAESRSRDMARKG